MRILGFFFFFFHAHYYSFSKGRIILTTTILDLLTVINTVNVLEEYSTVIGWLKKYLVIQVSYVKPFG